MQGLRETDVALANELIAICDQVECSSTADQDSLPVHLFLLARSGRVEAAARFLGHTLETRRGVARGHPSGPGGRERPACLRAGAGLLRAGPPADTA